MGRVVGVETKRKNSSMKDNIGMNEKWKKFESQQCNADNEGRAAAPT